MKAKNFPPVVSVIIPVHGDAPHLISTIQSIQEQNFKEFETFIILDRASEDIEKYAQDLTLSSENIKVLLSKLPGISHALNLGIRESSGEFIARIDADDLMRNDRLLLQKAFLEKHPEVVCVGSQITKINVDGIVIGKSSYPASNKQISRTLLFRNCLAHPSVMYRRSSILEVGGYRPEFDGVEDYDLWLRLSKTGQIRNMNAQLTSYRVWKKQITRKKKHLITENANRSRHSFQDSSDNRRCLSKFEKSDWLLSAEYFNKSLESLQNSGRRLSAFQSLFISFKLTPSLTARICASYALNYFSARIRSRNREN
jgi:glycosyltransferase involved in cell wall biosynthesis